MVDLVTKLEQDHDILEAVELSTAEKRFGWSYLTYRFPINTTLTAREEEGLRSLLLEYLTQRQREVVITTLKSVQRRDAGKSTGTDVRQRQKRGRLASLEYGEAATQDE